MTGNGEFYFVQIAKIFLLPALLVFSTALAAAQNFTLEQVRGYAFPTEPTAANAPR